VFIGLIQTVEKLQKKCIIKFSEASMRIICNQEEGGVHVWSYVVIPSLPFFSVNGSHTRKIRVDALFTDYRIISHSNNEITLILSTDALSTALRSASAEHTGANEIVMKLAKKKNVPVLSFEIFGTTHMGRRVKVAHDVRIEVMKPADVALLTEPRCPEPDVRRFRFYSREKKVHTQSKLPDCRSRSCSRRSPRYAPSSSACGTSQM